MNLLAQFVGYFKRRKKPYMVLDMHPADTIVAMTTFRDKVVVASRDGKIFLLEVDEFQ